MKKIIVMALVLLMATTSALADDLGVQIIGGPEVETEPISLDDLRLNVAAPIDGYGTITCTEFEYVDEQGFYDQGCTELSVAPWGTSGFHYSSSGDDADYAILRMDIMNTSPAAKNFLENCEVKVVYDEYYEYGGWCYQRNYNNKTYDYSAFGADNNAQNKRFGIDKVDNFAIGPMYEGHYLFGCALPNAVVKSKSPLRMVIMLDGNELTYNIRK